MVFQDIALGQFKELDVLVARKCERNTLDVICRAFRSFLVTSVNIWR